MQMLADVFSQLYRFVSKVNIMSISTKINEFKLSLEPKGVKLIAVSKTKPIETLQEAYDFVYISSASSYLPWLS